jgi:hypothetical protein
MESYEVEVKGKTLPVKAIRGLTGHDILRYKIHGDKQVPFVKTQTNQRMEEGDVFAIETFGSTGRGRIREDDGVYGYGRNENVDTSGVRMSSAKALLKTIDENFGTLVFSRRYLEQLGVKNYHLGMKSLIEQGVVECYEPLVDIPGSYVAQFEHVSDFPICLRHKLPRLTMFSPRLCCSNQAPKKSFRGEMTTDQRLSDVRPGLPPLHSLMLPTFCLQHYGSTEQAARGSQHTSI